MPSRWRSVRAFLFAAISVWAVGFDLRDAGGRMDLVYGGVAAWMSESRHEARRLHGCTEAIGNTS